MAKPKIVSNRIYAVVNQKGGAGKSTTAAHLAYWLKSQGSVLFVEADKQPSSSPWVEELGLDFETIYDPEDLIEKLPQFAAEYDSVVVDGPGNASEVTKAILTRCHVAIVPNRASDLDLRSSGLIVTFIKHVREYRQDLIALMFVNAAKSRSILLREAKEVLTECSIPLLNTVINDWTSITDSPGQRKTVFQMGAKAVAAAKAYDALFTEILEAAANGKA